MKNHIIYYNEDFKTQFRKLPKVIQEKAIKKEEIFRENPLHRSLRLHRLRGKLKDLWSISITMKYRIIFQITEEEEILFVSIGTHAIYEGNF